MNRKTSYTLGELSRLMDLELRGDDSIAVSGLASLQSAGPGQLSFLSNPAFTDQLRTCQASAVIVPEAQASLVRGAALVSGSPYLSYAQASQLFAALAEAERDEPPVHPSATVHDSARIADDVRIGPHACIGPDVHLASGVRIGAGSVVEQGSRLGEATLLHANVTVHHGVHIGKRVILHPGAVIGSDGFGFASDGRRSVKIAQLGGVLIGDDVEIGANSTIDRGALDDTVIEEGVKIDNLVQIAHNCFVGAHSILCGCSAMAGSARLGRYCTVGGGVGIIGHVSIADHSVITGMSFVNEGIDKAGLYSSGTLLQESRDWKKSALRFMKLDDLAKRIRRLEKAVKKNDSGTDL